MTLPTLPTPPPSSTPAPPQQRHTPADYARAEKFMNYNTTPMVDRAGVRPSWIAEDRFWYRITTASGTEFVLVDPAPGTRQPAFDHAKLAAARSSASGTTYDASHLPSTQVDRSGDGQTVSFNIGRERWKC